MNQNSNQVNAPMAKLNKKMSKKGPSQIPLDALGFRSKLFYDSTYQYVPRKKYNKISKYASQKRQQNFRSRLSCIIDPSHATHQQIGDMNFNKRTEWKKIKYVIFRTKQQLHCCICLSKEFVAPQMTFCGHVFCWHCILMHYEKSLKATSCPVCNQIFDIQQLKTCITLFLPPILQGDKIKFSLKSKTATQKSIFNPQTMQQQTNLSHIIRMKNINSLQKYKDQHETILGEMKKNEDSQTQTYLIKVLQRNQKKVDQLKIIIEEDKLIHYKLHKHEVFVGGVLCRVINPEDIENQKFMTFYQQEQGRYAYLHPICEKYLRKNFQQQYLPLKIEEEVLLKQETQFSNQNFKKYKYLNHLPQNQDFDFVFIRMNNLIDYKLMEEFQKQFQLYKKKRQEVNEREQQYSKLLNQKYQRQQQYLKQLKKMEQSQYHDIKVPTNMVDLSEIQDSNIFPSLVQTPSRTESNQKSSIKQLSLKSEPVIFNKKNKTKQNKFSIKEQDFPGLKLAVKLSLQQSINKEDHPQQIIMRTHSQNPMKQQITNKIQQNQFPQIQTSSEISSNLIKPKRNKQQEEQQNSRRKGKKKNKQKFVDVTHQFFHKNEQDQ